MSGLSNRANKALRHALADLADGDIVYNILKNLSAPAGTAITLDNGFVVTVGGGTITAGGLAVTAGGITSGTTIAATTTITAGTGLTVTTGGAVINGALTGLTSAVSTGAATATNVDLVSAATTTGKALDISDLDLLTSGQGLHLASAATAITSAGHLLYSNHTGNAGVSATLNEFASAAADETVVVKITASAALALGAALQISGAAVTTGNAIKAIDLDALTTGNAVDIRSNSSSTGTRALINVVNDNTAAVGTTGLLIQNDATAGAHIKLTGTGVNGIDFTALTAADTLFDCTAGTGCTAAPQTNAPTGFVNILVAGVARWLPYYSAT